MLIFAIYNSTQCRLLLRLVGLLVLQVLEKSKSEAGTPKVTTIHPVGNMNACTKL